MKNVHRSSCKAFVTLFRLELNFNFIDGISKSTQTSYVMKICTVGAELLRVDTWI